MQTFLITAATIAVIGSTAPGIAQDVLPFDNPAYVRTPEKAALIKAAQGDKAAAEASCAAKNDERAQTAPVAGVRSETQGQRRVPCDALPSRDAAPAPSSSGSAAAAATPSPGTSD